MKECYTCHRNEDAVQKVISEKMLKDPPALFNLINLGKENVYICCVCRQIFEQLFNDVVFPSFTPIIQETLSGPLTKLLSFTESFIQMLEMVGVDFDFIVCPQTDQNYPPAKMDFEVSYEQVETFVRKFMRGANHIMSHLGMGFRYCPMPTEKKEEFPEGIPRPEDV